MDYAREYKNLHQDGKTLAGYSLKHYVDDVAALVELTSPISILDLGSGKGYQYLVRRFHERWGGLLPTCYDVGVAHLSARPEGTFDGLICTDVLEHIEEADIDAFLDDALGFLSEIGRVFAFLTASCRLSKGKTLRDGRDVHVTVRPPEWWENRIAQAIKRRAHLNIVVRVCFDFDDENGRRHFKRTEM